MIHCEQQSAGVVFAVKAHVGARKNAVTGEHDGALKVSVAQPPEKGKANKAIVELLAQSLELSRSQIELLTGETSNQKRFIVSGVALADLQTRLATLVDAR